MDFVSMESNFLFWSGLKISSILNFTQSLVPLFRMSEFLFRMRNKLMAPPSPGPLFHFSRHSFPFLQLQLPCQPGSLNPLPHNPFPQVKINKMSVSWLLFGLHLTSFFLFWAFRFLSGNYKPCLTPWWVWFPPSWLLSHPPTPTPSFPSLTLI